MDELFQLSILKSLKSKSLNNDALFVLSRVTEIKKDYLTYEKLLADISDSTTLKVLKAAGQNHNINYAEFN